jgi:hypothetical protein
LPLWRSSVAVVSLAHLTAVAVVADDVESSHADASIRVAGWVAVAAFVAVAVGPPAAVAAAAVVVVVAPVVPTT